MNKLLLSILLSLSVSGSVMAGDLIKMKGKTEGRVKHEFIYKMAAKHATKVQVKRILLMLHVSNVMATLIASQLMKVSWRFQKRILTSRCTTTKVQVA